MRQGVSVATQKAPKTKKQSTVTIIAAIAPVGEGYVPSSAQVGSLTIKQRNTLKALFNGLQGTHAKVPTPSRPIGKHVDSYGDVIRYLLENAKETL